MVNWFEKQLEKGGVTPTALSILVKAGTLERCEGHGTHFQGSGDLTAAYRLANLSLSEGGADLSVAERNELTEAIKVAFGEHENMTRCEVCAEQGGS